MTNCKKTIILRVLILILMSTLLLVTPMFNLIIVRQSNDDFLIAVSGYDRWDWFNAQGGFFGHGFTQSSTDKWLWIYDFAVVTTWIVVSMAILGFISGVVSMFLKNEKVQKVFTWIIMSQFACTLLYMIMGFMYKSLGQEGFKGSHYFSTDCFVPFLIGATISAIYFCKLRQLSQNQNKTTKNI